MCSALCDPYHVTQSLLEILNAFLSFSLMIIFMSMNAVLCVAVLIGLGLGYFLFRWRTDTNIYEPIEPQ